MRAAGVRDYGRVPGDTGTAPAALQPTKLRKAFGDTVAVSGVDLDVQPGAFFGLVGPNGAGKTTILEMAVGLLRPDSGSACVLGHDVWSAQERESGQAKSLLGVLPDGLALPQRLKPGSGVRPAGRCRGAGSWAVMVRVLIGLRRTVARNQLRSAGAGWLVGGLLLGLLCAGGTLALGVVHYQRPGAAADVWRLSTRCGSSAGSRRAR
jgi:energy-coupling factor transporter ATP-binding protein EcfA2